MPSRELIEAVLYGLYQIVYKIFRTGLYLLIEFVIDQVWLVMDTLDTSFLKELLSLGYYFLKIDNFIDFINDSTETPMENNSILNDMETTFFNIFIIISLNNSWRHTFGFYIFLFVYLRSKRKFK